VPLNKIKAGTIYPVIKDSENHEFFNRICPLQSSAPILNFVSAMGRWQPILLKNSSFDKNS